MKAMRFHDYGGPEVLRYEDVDVPEPAAGQVRVRVAATSFNGVDANIRAGFMREPIPTELPHTPGLDVSGTIDALGAGVEAVEVGGQVVAFLPMTDDGAAAQFVIAPSEVLAAAPTSIPIEDAAAFPLVALTAYQALFDHAGVQAGQRVLVNGAGGAVGGYAVQLAKGAGAHVVAVVGEHSARRAEAAGADEIVTDPDRPLADTVKEPVDVAVNLAPVAPERLGELLALVRDGGVLVNTTVWMPAPSDAERGVQGIDLFVRSDSAQLARIVELIDAGELHVDVAERVALEDLARVHVRAASGGVSGKIVVVVG